MVSVEKDAKAILSAFTSRFSSWTEESLRGAWESVADKSNRLDEEWVVDIGGEYLNASTTWLFAGSPAPKGLGDCVSYLKLLSKSDLKPRQLRISRTISTHIVFQGSLQLDYRPELDSARERIL